LYSISYQDERFGGIVDLSEFALLVIQDVAGLNSLPIAAAY